MDRRTFLALTGTTVALARGGDALPRDPKEKPVEPNADQNAVKMQLGSQRGPTNVETLQYLKRHGVNHICGYPDYDRERGYWTTDEVAKTRELCEQQGVALDMCPLPFLSSSHIDREKRGAIMLADDPERDRDIEHVQKMIVALAEAGVPAFKYNMSLLGVLRTERTPGRGGSSYSTWKLPEAKADPPLTRAGRVDDDKFWERITYFLERIIPVCNEHQIRAACHPHDPGTPPEGFQGINRVLGTVEGMKKFISIQESPYHGFNLCLGTTAENLQDPATEIHDLIRYLGTRKKIFNIHFRNIRGKRDDFQEVYPDEGDMDMLQVAFTLQETGYEHMLMPDHMPTHPDDPSGKQAFAFGYGYITAILQAVRARS